jgi:hypothetical protein
MIMHAAVTLVSAAVWLATIAAASVAYAQMMRPTIVVKHPPIGSPGDVSGSWSARQNVIEDKQYEQALRTNPAFRQARMGREWGPITDPELHKSCLASFDRN